QAPRRTHLRLAHQADMTDALKALLLMHKGVAWLPESAAAREVADRHFTALRGDDEWTLKLEINLYRARENARPVVGKLWRHLVKDDAA
ncbi:MAG: LysR substrate-binding domain-containing protein, partial [Betaproteobacteria bacterium]|nr:LysR substrate-binding domain-containing protein [Betaproteobacteria bacterium]